MEALWILLLIGFLLFFLIAPIVALFKSIAASRDVQSLRELVVSLQGEIRQLRRETPAAGPSPAGAPTRKTQPVAAAEPMVPPPPSAPPPVQATAPAAVESRATPPPIAPPAVHPPASPPPTEPPPLPAAAFASPGGAASAGETPSPLSVASAIADEQPASSFSWEQFVGVKLFAWLGGIVLFVSLVYFVKLSFDEGWIPPPVRAALGFLLGAGLLVGGVASVRRAYVATGQSLCATGVIVLYTVTFACRAYYRFPFFTVVPTFLLMVLVTAVAFLLADRLRAQVVAILGLLGGFLTPVVLSTGVDNPVGLFGYLALLDLGLLAVALRCRWPYLAMLAVAGTVALQIGWADEFFTVAKLPTAIAVCALFMVLFTAAVAAARRFDRASDWVGGAALVPPLVAAGFSLWFTGLPEVAAQPGWVLGNVLLADLVVLAVAVLYAPLARTHLFAGLGALFVTTVWIARAATTALLPWALGFVFLFAALHAVFPFVLRRFNPDADETCWSGLFAPIGLLVLLIPIASLDDVGGLLWPAVLLLNLVALAAAVSTGLLAALAGAIMLTLIAIGVAILQLPAATAGGGFELALIAGFAVAFVAGSVWLVRRAAARTDDQAAPAEPPWLLNLPGASAAMPFLLLVMLVLRLRLGDPSPVFGVALLLVALCCGLGTVARQGMLVLAAFAGTLALEYLWFDVRFGVDNAGIALAWFAGFAAVFLVFPFAVRARLLDVQVPWAVAALSLPLHFILLKRGVDTLWPNDLPGALPLLCALPPLAGLVVLLRAIPADAPYRLNRLAWFAAATLFFVTLIFPLQFSNEWLTISWAFEGAALLWLFHRVPHPGLRMVGVGLLVVVFVRLVFNPEVFDYAARGERPIFNWMLWTYGAATICCFLGARLLAPSASGEPSRVPGLRVAPLLLTMGTILVFALLNLEIADTFTPTGERLRLEFTGNLARDMSYTIAWAVFALVLLVAGIRKNLRAARYAAIVLLLVTALKLLVFDLANLETGYRIAASMAVALVAIAASFIYQKFLGRPGTTMPKPQPLSK